MDALVSKCDKNDRSDHRRTRVRRVRVETKLLIRNDLNTLGLVENMT